MASRSANTAKPRTASTSTTPPSASLDSESARSDRAARRAAGAPRRRDADDDRAGGDRGGTLPPIPGAHGENLTPYLAKGQLPALEAYSETWLPRNQFNWSELKARSAPGGTGDYKFIDAPEPELYALAQDPAEARNLVADAAEGATRVAAMKKIIARLEQDSQAVAAAATRRRHVNSDVVEAEKFLSLGYIGPVFARRRGGARRVRRCPIRREDRDLSACDVVDRLERSGQA